MFYSPLRYPGGKSKLTAYVVETLKLNGLEGGTYVEPFAGGCAIAWYLLLEGHVENVWVNDLDPAIHAFWYSVLNRTDELCQLIENTDVTIEEWFRQKEVYSNDKTNSLQLGFATFFLNRTNRSGIIKAGVIGGLEQNGNYLLDCRYNKERLTQQIRAIAARRENIVLTNVDATLFIDEYLPDIDGPCLVNIDPPYYVKGKGLYQNFFKHDDHYRLYRSVRNIQHPWIVTYDDTPEIAGIYAEFDPQPFGLTYTAQTKRKGSELIIHSPTIHKVLFKPDISFNELRKLKNLGKPLK
ncbi:DNA adenine methylase [Vibrio alginolyticus]|uniref:site-specific DNA-methyltransferase (adenine-specific) n=2 Tax=root TaxID=1 RepID=A0A7D7FB62_9CAUD|nr:DNA adenine methylase [Vibrio alginolyticus]YP_010109768.1 DNA adenine methylase [Vibrio phage ValB1MD-2]AVF70003.1 DNA methyltransferase [Vibrio alginolyticus]EHI5142711.1 DNA adenine methylase [Vibrio alginolyticus]ELB2869980.1 DNA adenine methylase [Vibrio alginolyticus]ELH9638156.1 DNA adenine methylase [Vibrio alginolyticus]MBY7678456.1 DNA adenine methylase [Vibrio alginolyticus]